MMIRIDEAVKRHLHFLRMTGKAQNTIDQADYKFNRFLELMGPDSHLDDFKTRQDVMPYIDALRDKQCQPVTINNYLSALRGLYDWAIAEHLVTHNPFHQLRVKVSEPLPQDVPSPRTILAIIDTIDVPLYRTFLTLQLHTGMRINEVRTLELGDVDMTERRIHIRESKAGKSRTVPLNDMIYAIMQTYLEEERRRVDSPLVFPSLRAGTICKTTINSHLTRAAAEVIGHKITSHKLRHAFTTHLYEQGVMETTLSELLGHREPKTTRRYIRVQENHLRDAVGRLRLD